MSWLCWPRFDSSFVFGGLIDKERGGSYRVAPAAEFSSAQEYIPNTNVLRTRFQAADGSFDIIDFAPRFFQNDRYYRPTMLVRKLLPISGNPLVRVVCRPTWNYGSSVLTHRMGSNHLAFSDAPAPLRLTTDVSLTHIVEERPFSLSRAAYLVMTWGDPLEAPLEQTCEDLLLRTVAYWQRWVKHCHLPDLRQSEVIRSALVLKLHQFEDTGGITAATTTSIPEAPGSSRNWDYRYCWLRDAYFTVTALRRLSHFEEVEGFERFLRDVVLTSKGRLQPVYSISGSGELSENELPYLAGYLGHKPVRVGNDAYQQNQYDIYGQAILALKPLFTDIRFKNGGEERPTDVVVSLLNAVEINFSKPDAGIWEFRGIQREYTFTKLMHWAGAVAAAQIGRSAALVSLTERAERIANAAEHWIVKNAWNDSLGSLQISPDLHELDASLLLAINLGFFQANDPRARCMVAAVQSALGSKNGLLQRYRFDDGLGPATTCFTVCSFWLVEALARVGCLDEAVTIFDSVMKHANHLGLLSEDIDVKSGAMWGNFPQTYSHVGLVNAAFALSAEAERQRRDPKSP